MRSNIFPFKSGPVRSKTSFTTQPFKWGKLTNDAFKEAVAGSTPKTFELNACLKISKVAPSKQPISNIEVGLNPVGEIIVEKKLLLASGFTKVPGLTSRLSMQ